MVIFVQYVCTQLFGDRGIDDLNIGYTCNVMLLMTDSIY